MQTRSQTIYSDRYVVNTVAPGNVEPTCKWVQDNSMAPTAWSAGTVGHRYGRGTPNNVGPYRVVHWILQLGSNEQEVIIG